jgi:hypothetical protein
MLGDWQGIPALIWFACAFLIVFFAVCLQRLAAQSGHVLRQCERFTQDLKHLRPQHDVNRRDGMQLEDLERLRAASSHWNGRQRKWWSNLENALEPYQRPDGSPGYFLADDPDNLLPWSEVIEFDYHGSFHDAVPGMLTGLGLMATFIAILLALQGVHVDIKGSTETVQGIGQLINGLSGKFLCSIVALALSVSYTLVEKRLGERRLVKAYTAMIEQVREVFPRLSSSRVLVDIESVALEQLNLMRAIYTELTERLPAAPPAPSEPELVLPDFPLQAFSEPAPEPDPDPEPERQPELAISETVQPESRPPNPDELPQEASA